MDSPSLGSEVAPETPPAKITGRDLAVSWLKLFVASGSVFEVRALDCRTSDYQRPHTRGGFFDGEHIAEAVTSALSLSNHAAANGVYFTLNPLDQSLLARRYNRVDVVRKDDRQSKDTDITGRRWLLFDCDPIRIAGVSSTDAEKEAAQQTALAIADHLTTAGWPSPIIADSGNGWHLLYRIDLPADDGGLVRQCLHALATRFDSPAVTIDRSVCNPARICKLYGTMSRKGDSTPERPHRRSFVTQIPDEIVAVPAERLQALAAEAPADSPKQKSAAHRRSGGKAMVIRRAKAYNAKLSPSIQGQNGSGQAYFAACQNVRGFDLSIEESLDALAEWNARCEPPWSESELRHKLEEAEAKADGEPGYLLSNGSSGSTVEAYRSAQFGPFTPDSEHNPNSDQPGVSPSTVPAPDPSLLDLQCEQGRTDHANGARFAFLNRGRVRFCHPWNRWLVWDGRRWEIDSRDAVMKLAKEMANQIWEQGFNTNDEKAARAILKHASNTASSRSLRAALSLASSEPGIAVIPDELDTDPWLLNCPNGTVDLRSGELRPHQQSDLITKLCPTTYNPNADIAVIDDFLASLFPGLEVRAFIKRLVGLCLTGDTSEQILPILWGSGSNGKSTFVESLLTSIGRDYFIEGARDLLIEKPGQSHPTELADLFGKRLVICSETDDGRRLAEGLAKKLTGGDRIKARRMREDFWEFAPTHKLWLMTNHKPTVRGTDHAIWRRLVLIPFEKTFWNPEAGETGPDELRRDNTLKDRLAEGAAGILAWAVQGCLEWQWHGLQIPSSIRAATESYRSDQDTVATFLADCCITGLGMKTKAKVIYAAYERWCDENGYRPLGQRKFGEIVGEKFERFTCAGTWYRGVEVRESEQFREHPEYDTADFVP